MPDARGVFMKRTIPSSALVVVPNSGHTVNLEEPGAFNAALADFFRPGRRRPVADARCTRYPASQSPA